MTFNWRQKRVLVIGGCGFIGSALVRRLEEIGEPEGICIFDLRRGQDIIDYNDVARTIGLLRPQVVFHLAAQTEVRRSFADPHSTYLANVLGTLNVLEACRLREVEALVVASSDKAYGDWAGRWYGLSIPLNEGAILLHNADAYSSSKAMADQLCQDYHRLYKMPIRILRCANTYGPGQTNKTTLITGTILRLLRGEAPVIHDGAEHVKREWLYVDDAVDAYLHMAQLAAHCPSGHDVNPVYNVGSGERYSVIGVVRKIQSAMWSVVEQARTPTFLPGSAPQIGDQGIDSTRYRKLMGDEQFTSFSQGLERTIAWYRENYEP